MNYRIKTGKQGEQLVVEYLQKHDYTIIAQNYRKQFGEIDIIACKDDVLAFIEVKFRSNPLIDPAEIISFKKQQSIIKIAKYFLSTSTIAHTDFICRFDVALIEKTNITLELRYIPNAFTDFN